MAVDPLSGDRRLSSGAVDWAALEPVFRWDGSWRDIYILDTELRDWAAVWELLMAAPEVLRFRVDGVLVAPPRHVEEVFRLTSAHHVGASIAVGTLKLNCHFFCAEQIEFDLDPREVSGPADAQHLCSFMATIGKLASKEVLLTSENVPEDVLARFLPAEGVVVWS